MSADDNEVAPGIGRNVIAQTRTGNPRPPRDDRRPPRLGHGQPEHSRQRLRRSDLLEIATRLDVEPSVKNTVRFAFLGHEESGALGSSGYLEGLSSGDRKKIKLYLTWVWWASSNGGYFVQGGKGNDPETAGPAGSATIARVLADQLAKTGGDQPGVDRVRRGRRIAVHRGRHPRRRR